jgi:hypothetical protein
MLKHDKYWNWEVKRGDKIYFISEDRMDIISESWSSERGQFKKGQEYEVVTPQATPNGIIVKNCSTNEHLWGEHSWFISENDWKNEKRTKLINKMLTKNNLL